MKYFKSLIITIFSKSNISFIVFMTINMAPLASLFTYHPSLYSLSIFIILLLLYFLFVIIIGESVARIMLKAYTRIDITDRTVLNVAFSNAYTIAKLKDPIISNNIKLYIYEGMAIDGYALGRNTLCLSSAALDLSEQDLTTLFLMKFAQFSHHDSEILSILSAGNIWYMILAVICKWWICVLGSVLWLIFTYVGHQNAASLVENFFRILANAAEKIILSFIKIILLLGINSYKNNIYINDAFICDCGYKNNLIRFLQDYESDSMCQETIFATINSMKPDKRLRLAKIYNYTPSSNNSDKFRIIRR